ncbi:unnamed protein product [Fusarium venenatum]|uniref:Uncharacterized protein n=1 Tax=Fusarium venenatum TaxID=56646 RepID=A0A2L2TBT1_9HYPO|nr:uncharacterized protein FVRRES_01965 [Fusarium venenatum]CEI65453.1 unnamed protein product [Fusarium venenatum]
MTRGLRLPLGNCNQSIGTVLPNSAVCASLESTVGFMHPIESGSD